MKRIISIFTGNRSDYGLQHSIIKAVDAHPMTEYRLIVSGTHLEGNFGRTLDEIRHDGFRIESKIAIRVVCNSLLATARSIGILVIHISTALAKIKPDIMMVYGDRFESFAAVIASTQMNIPTAHVEGGDLTEGGALDDSVRHAMTKLAHLHFTTNEQATNRILAMGEESWRVHTVGLPAVDLISEGCFATPTEVIASLGLDLSRPILLLTQHSVTTEFEKAAFQFQSTLVAIEKLAVDGVQIVITYPNNDAGGQALIEILTKLTNQNLPGIQIHKSLGRYLYHGLLALARDSAIRIACVGNSSSGIKETPAFGCPTVNIGSRQDGRLRGLNVLDVEYDFDAIEKAAIRCFYDETFRNTARNAENPYCFGYAGTKIANVLATVPLNQKLIRKSMTIKGEKSGDWYR
jgi:UDP-hydrolysing UDP-N-acetyl-D-glucosamine 2-epimerase